jgi:hypothetical protein
MNIQQIMHKQQIDNTKNDFSISEYRRFLGEAIPKWPWIGFFASLFPLLLNGLLL